MAAELLGYSSGDELVQALVKTRPMDELIDEKTDSLMRKEYGDMLTDGTAAEKAREAVMTIRRSEVIEAEQQALAKAVRAAEPLQAALVAAIAKWFRGDDEDSWAETLAREGLSSAFGLMVGVREAEGAAERLLLAGAISARLFGAGRAARLLRPGRLATQFHQGEWDRALRKAIVSTVGVVKHLPAGQINRTLDGIVALMDGRTSNPTAVLFGAPKK